MEATHEQETKDQTPNEFEKYNDAININTLPIFTRSQLSLYNGVDKSELYVAIRGYIYDVTNNLKNYGPGRPYHKLTGKDVSRLLGLNQMQLKKPTSDDPYMVSRNNTWYTDDLTEKQNLIVDKWILFFRKRYRAVGLIVDHEVG